VSPWRQLDRRGIKGVRYIFGEGWRNLLPAKGLVGSDKRQVTSDKSEGGQGPKTGRLTTNHANHTNIRVIRAIRCFRSGGLRVFLRGLRALRGLGLFDPRIRMGHGVAHPACPGARNRHKRAPSQKQKRVAGDIFFIPVRLGT
jgi:hypothetical protein